MMKSFFLGPLGIPLAWRQLVLDKKRFIIALLGVGFAVVLMIAQIGIYSAFMMLHN